jgi:hypothetical protein
VYPDIVLLRSKLRFARANPEKFKEQEQKVIKSFNRVDDALSLNANVFDNLKSQQGEDVSLLNLNNSDNVGDGGTIDTKNHAETDDLHNTPEDQLPEVVVTGGPDGSGDELSDHDLGEDINNL